jgi:ribosomal-protein-alanine acetyltransferase
MPEHSRVPSSSGTEVRIREAEPSDINELVELERAAFASDRLSRRQLRTLAASPSASLQVAERGGRPVGYVLVLTRRGSRTARLYSIAVAPAAAGSGLGSLLLRTAEEAARARGADELRLEVRADNISAIRLYQAHGYAAFGRREDYYQDGSPALRYSRHLRDRPGDRAGAPALCRVA